MANAMLLWFVSYSNFTSIAVVTFCFVAMTIFIGLISINGDNSRNSALPMGIEQRNMVKVSNPFFLKLEQQNQKLADGMKLHLSSLMPGQVFVLWGAKINPFHDLILKQGKSIRQSLMHQNMQTFQDLDILHFDKIQFPEPGEHVIELSCPSAVTSETLGDVPRQRYPAAIFILVPEKPQNDAEDMPDQAMYDASDISGNSLDDTIDGNEASCRSSASLSEDDNSSEIVGLISIIHLRDEKVLQCSHIISQYVKTAGVPVYSLQPLFMNRESSSAQHREQHKGAKRTDISRERAESQSRVHHEDNLPDDGKSIAEQSGVGKDQHRHICGEKSSNIEHSKNIDRNCDTSNAGIASRFRGGAVNSSGNDDIKNDSDNSFNVENSDDEEIDSRQNLRCAPEAECVVCQTRRVKCALLPCRHACVCISCFKLIDKCPMCRSHIETFFVLQNSGYDESASDDNDDDGEEDEGNDMLEDMQQAAVNANFAQLWERINRRLNEMLGFR